jgi:phage terminase large subunit-like protein
MVSNITIKRPKFTEYQKNILMSEKRFTVTEASTKCGKTFSHIYWLFEEAHKGKEGEFFWWIAPVFGQAEIAFKRMARKVAESGAYIINLSKLTITTPLGTIIAFKSADNPNTLYGENVYAFVFDEYSRAKEEAWFALRSTITFTKGKGKFIGNVVARNWAYELARKAESGTDPDFEYFKITAYEAVDAGILDISEIEQAKRDLPSRIFKMLYLADFSEIEGALWSYDLIDSARVTQAPDMVRIVIAIDPAVTSNKDSDETGIIVAGKGSDGAIYVFEDLSGIYTPQEWAGKVLFAYEKHKADRIIAEVNNGGDMVETILRNYEKNISYDSVHATKGKFTRAEPVQALYEQKRVHHVGVLNKLEEQMTSWAPMTDKSPDRVDALVWAVTYLMGEVKTNDFWVA